MKISIKIHFFITLLTTIHTLALDPRHDYLKMETENFHMIFDAKSYEDAKDHLRAAERSHRLLADLFGETPSYTVLLVETDTDLANGAATGVPRPTIFSFAQAPTSMSSVNYFSNWPEDVILHEYAHVLNMEPANGVFAPLRWVFGSLVRPNMFLPRWYLEGLAVELESRFNETGRLKSTDYDALIRALYLDGKWGKENLSQINEVTTPSWPQGQRPYFYGALLWHEIYEKYGPESVEKLNQRYGGRFPYFISAPIEDLSGGKDYSALLKDVYEKYQSYAQEQIEMIQKSQATAGRKIAIEDSLIQHSASISPDGKKLAFVNVTVNGDSEIYLLRRDSVNSDFSFNTGTKIKSISKTEIQKVSWFPDSEKIIFDAIDTFDRHLLYFDLYTYDFKTQKTEKITKGLRAREASLSPDGNTLVYVRAESGQVRLETMNLKTKNSKIIWTPPQNIRVSRPAFINSSRIVFAQKKPDGKDQLKILDLGQNKIIHEMKDLEHSTQPIVTTDGIVFTSYDSGVENLYLSNFEFKNILPLTNSLTKIINGTYDSKSKTLYYSELTGNGISLKKSNSSRTVVLPKIPHPIRSDFEDYKIAEAKTKANEPAPLPEPEDYWAARYMFPQYWVPFFNSTEDGTITSISIPGSDARGHHQYLVSALYDSRPAEWSTAFTYGWVNSLGITKASVFDAYTYYISLDRSTNDRGVSGEHEFYIPGLSNNFKASFGFEYEEATIAVGSGEVKHYFKGPFVGFNYSNLEQKLTEIAPAGQNFYVKVTEYLPNNTDTEYRETLGHFSHYHSKWLPKRHRLAFKVTGVHTEENRSILLGTTSSETPYTFGPLTEGFFLRGYPTGEFIGYSMALGKLEYKFPVADMYSGPDNPFPIFTKRLHGEIFVETLSLKGIYFEKDTENSVRTEFGKYFTSAGVEGKMDLTLFYHVPVTFVIGGAYGFQDEAQGDFRFYTLLQSPLLFQ